MTRVLNDQDGAWGRTVMTPDAYAREQAAWSRTLHGCLLTVVRRYGRYHWSVRPIHEPGPAMAGVASMASAARVEAMTACRGWDLEQRERAHEAALYDCALCEQPTPPNDRLPYGAAKVHAACAFEASKRLRTAKIAVLIKRQIKQRTATGG